MKIRRPANMPQLEGTFRSIEQGIEPIEGLPEHAKSELPAATGRKRLIYVTDEVGGAVPAFNDGTNWRRVTDRAIVS